MPENIAEACSHFCRRYLCHILSAIIAAGFTFAGLSMAHSVDVDRLARSTATQQDGIRSSLDTHLAQERIQNEKVMDALGSIQSDIAVMKYRMDRDTP